MGYRSIVQFKTTTEGYVILKQFNDKIEKRDERPLYGAEIQKTEDGFYRVSFDAVKWYESFPDIQNFIKVMDMLNDRNIPYKFIRIGEVIDDIEVRENYTEDMPDELETFEPQTTIYDEDEGSYETIVASGKDLFTSSRPEEGGE